MELPDKISVTDQTIDISNLSTKEVFYYEKLAYKIINLYQSKDQGRQIYGLSGPAGSGKSVVAEILAHVIKSKDISFDFTNIGLDAFHYTNEVLDELGLRNVKGRYDTYNMPLLNKKLKSFQAGEVVNFPAYSRTTHNPVPDAIRIENQNTLLLLEGQWLLRKSNEWKNIQNYISYQFSVDGDPKSLRENVVARHVAGGRGHFDAEKFYEDNDLVNTKEILENSIKPDEKILFYKDI